MSMQKDERDHMYVLMYMRGGHLLIPCHRQEKVSGVPVFGWDFVCQELPGFAGNFCGRTPASQPRRWVVVRPYYYQGGVRSTSVQPPTRKVYHRLLPIIERRWLVSTFLATRES